MRRIRTVALCLVSSIIGAWGHNAIRWPATFAVCRFDGGDCLPQALYPSFHDCTVFRDRLNEWDRLRGASPNTLGRWECRE